MITVSTADLEILSNKEVVKENVIRPLSYIRPSIDEIVGDRFITLEPHLDNIYVGKKEDSVKLIYWFAYIAKYEKSMNPEEITTYLYNNCPIKINKKNVDDLGKIIINALTV